MVEVKEDIHDSLMILSFLLRMYPTFYRMIALGRTSLMQAAAYLRFQVVNLKRGRAGISE